MLHSLDRSSIFPRLRTSDLSNSLDSFQDLS